MITLATEIDRQKSSSKKLLKIGEVAKQTDVEVGTIRYYESLGLLIPIERSDNGYRYYDDEAIERLKFIKKAQSLRFSLAEIHQVLGVRSSGSPACPIVKGLLKQKIAGLEQQIELMKEMKQELEAYQSRWESRPLDNPSGKDLCSMIGEVIDRDLPTHQSRSVG
ncbi:heavy metal-responsive transcriptional regulator [Chamaesiphon minutus]|uniref:Putative transcriptional regulator n=1 Tax=Chamaesiphon minutus (strain ATCC 27169 / PCC 6605) TaxID=1173020 RepID=K9UCK4_CHAP6|nr:heavy metal-responsive transcriptional regulator [Chamaesiphon minutus]AFY92812.1 putative transcriptional regulator [Chamaesiphon minutus PCC 6605]